MTASKHPSDCYTRELKACIYKQGGQKAYFKDTLKISLKARDRAVDLPGHARQIGEPRGSPVREEQVERPDCNLELLQIDMPPVRTEGKALVTAIP